MPQLFIGSPAPDFKCATTKGDITLYDYIDGKNWVVLFSHPEDATPVCTTEFGAFTKLQDEFEKRGAKLLGLSPDSIEEHIKWQKDVEEIAGVDMKFPIIADDDLAISKAYNMLDWATINAKGAEKGWPIRAVFIIDPEKKIRLMLFYPGSTGRNSHEVLRCLDSLQLADKHKIVTGADWKPGDDVIVPPKISNTDAIKKFGEVKEVKSYLRYASIPGEQNGESDAKKQKLANGTNGIHTNGVATNGSA